jgi:hypothetical protein
VRDKSGVNHFTSVTPLPIAATTIVSLFRPRPGIGIPRTGKFEGEAFEKAVRDLLCPRTPGFSLRHCQAMLDNTKGKNRHQHKA